MRSWQKVFREGLVPLLSDESLEVLRQVLEADDPRLLKGVTTEPRSLGCTDDWPVEGARLLGVIGWLGDGLETVGEVQEYFGRLTSDIDQRVGDPSACRWLINWFDETLREEMRSALLAGVDLALAGRR